MAGCGIPQVDELAGAEQGLAAFRVWTRKRAMARDASPKAVLEYVQTTTRLLELDQEYWRGIAGANADLVAAQRGRLLPHERRAITERLLVLFQAVYQECEDRMRPLLARLPEVLQHREDTRRRRAWVLELDGALTCYALALQDTIQALREEQQSGSAPSLLDEEAVG
jgi:hypothetical protein